MYKILGNREIKFTAFDDQANTAGFPSGTDFPDGDDLTRPPSYRGLPGKFVAGQPLPSANAFGPDTYNAKWSFEVDPWQYRAILGVRFHWLGGD